VLLLHGLFASGAFWLPFARQLGDGFEIVIPDLMGFGRSAKPEADYTAAFHLDALAPLVDSQRDWMVLGHSLGSALAVQAARRWPDRIRAVVLFNAPVYASADRRAEIFSRQHLLSR